MRTTNPQAPTRNLPPTPTPAPTHPVPPTVHPPTPTVDAINSCHSAQLSAAQAATAHRQLSAYFQRFQPRLAPSNCRHLQTLLRVAQARAGRGGEVQAVAGALRLPRRRQGTVSQPGIACTPGVAEGLACSRCKVGSNACGCRAKPA